MTKNALDMIDEKIVELLQENARIAIKEIAAQVFLSSPAVTARIERLESKGIIKGYHATVDSDKGFCQSGPGACTKGRVLSVY